MGDAVSAKDELFTLLEAWGIDPHGIPEDGLLREGYETFALDENGRVQFTPDLGYVLRRKLHPYPEGFPYMQAMEIYERLLEERIRR